jgi:exonuclease III
MTAIATWNVNSLRIRLPQVTSWLANAALTTPVDILAMQETKLTDPEFPRAELEALGYHVMFSGQKTYNGVAVMSRWPCGEVVTDIPNFENPLRRVKVVAVESGRAAEPAFSGEDGRVVISGFGPTAVLQISKAGYVRQSLPTTSRPTAALDLRLVKALGHLKAAPERSGSLARAIS